MYKKILLLVLAILCISVIYAQMSSLEFPFYTNATTKKNSDTLDLQINSKYTGALGQYKSVVANLIVNELDEWADVMDVKRDGNLLYYGVGEGGSGQWGNFVTIYYISNWSRLTTLRDFGVEHGSGYVSAIEYDDNYLYAGGNAVWDHVRVYNKYDWENVYNISAPHIVESMAQDNNNIYFVGAFDTVRVHRKTDFASVANVSFDAPQSYAVAVDSNYIYAGGQASNEHLFIYRTSDFSNVATISVKPGYDIESIEVDDNYVYVGTEENKVYIYTKSNWNNIKNLTVGPFSTCSIMSLLPTSNLLYTGDWCQNITSFYISNWSFHDYIQTRNYEIQGLATDSTYIFSSEDYSAARAYALEDIDDVGYTETQWVNTKNLSETLDAHDGYVAENDNYIYTSDFETPDEDIKIYYKYNWSITSFGGRTNSYDKVFAVDNTFLILGNDSYWADVYYVDNLTLADSLYSFDTGDDPGWIEMDEDFIYLNGEHPVYNSVNQIYVFYKANLTNVANLTEDPATGNVWFGGGHGDDDLFYYTGCTTACIDDYFEIWIRYKANFTSAKNISLTGWAEDVDSDSNLVYSATSLCCNPPHPDAHSQVFYKANWSNFQNLSYQGDRIHTDDNLIYLEGAGGNRGSIYLFYKANFSNFLNISYPNEWGNVRNIHSDDNYLYMAPKSSGVSQEDEAYMIYLFPKKTFTRGPSSCYVNITGFSYNQTIAHSNDWCNGTVTLNEAALENATINVYANSSFNEVMDSNYVVWIDNTPPTVTLPFYVNETQRNESDGLSLQIYVEDYTGDIQRQWENVKNISTAPNDQEFVIVDDSYVYFSASTTIYVYSKSDWTSVVNITTLDIPWVLADDDDYVYAAIDDFHNGTQMVSYVMVYSKSDWSNVANITPSALWSADIYRALAVDSNYVYTGEQDSYRNLTIFRKSDWSKYAEFEYPLTNLYQVEVDNNYIYLTGNPYSGEPSKVFVYNKATLTNVANLTPPDVTGSNDQVVELLVDHDYIYFAGVIYNSDWDYIIPVYDKSFNPVTNLAGPTDEIWAMTSDKTTLYVSDRDGNIILYYKGNWTNYKNLTKTPGGVDTLSIAVDDNYLYASGWDDMLNVFSLDNRSEGAGASSPCLVSIGSLSNQSFVNVDGWCNSTASLAGLESGNQVIYAWGNDTAGNLDLNDDYIVDVNPEEEAPPPGEDLSAPTTSCDSDDKVHNEDYVVNLTCSDSGSGCDYTKYCVSTSDCYPSTQENPPVHINFTPDSTDKINYTIKFYSVDNADNIEDNKTCFVIMEKCLQGEEFDPDLGCYLTLGDCKTDCQNNGFVDGYIFAKGDVAKCGCYGDQSAPVTEAQVTPLVGPVNSNFTFSVKPGAFNIVEKLRMYVKEGDNIILEDLATTDIYHSMHKQLERVNITKTIEKAGYFENVWFGDAILREVDTMHDGFGETFAKVNDWSYYTGSCEEPCTHSFTTDGDRGEIKIDCNSGSDYVEYSTPLPTMTDSSTIEIVASLGIVDQPGSAIRVGGESLPMDQWGIGKDYPAFTTHKRTLNNIPSGNLVVRVKCYDGNYDAIFAFDSLRIYPSSEGYNLDEWKSEWQHRIPIRAYSSGGLQTDSNPLIRAGDSGEVLITDDNGVEKESISSEGTYYAYTQYDSIEVKPSVSGSLILIPGVTQNILETEGPLVDAIQLTITSLDFESIKVNFNTNYDSENLRDIEVTCALNNENVYEAETSCSVNSTPGVDSCIMSGDFTCGDQPIVYCDAKDPNYPEIELDEVISYEFNVGDSPEACEACGGEYNEGGWQGDVTYDDNCCGDEGGVVVDPETCCDEINDCTYEGECYDTGQKYVIDDKEKLCDNTTWKGDMSLCTDVTCDSYCSGDTYYYAGYCDANTGECNYKSNPESKNCVGEEKTVELVCEGVDCPPTLCDGNTLKSGGRCVEGECIFTGSEVCTFACETDECLHVGSVRLVLTESEKKLVRPREKVKIISKICNYGEQTVSSAAPLTVVEQTIGAQVVSAQLEKDITKGNCASLIWEVIIPRDVYIFEPLPRVQIGSEILYPIYPIPLVELGSELTQEDTQINIFVKGRWHTGQTLKPVGISKNILNIYDSSGKRVYRGEKAGIAMNGTQYTFSPQELNLGYDSYIIEAETTFHSYRGPGASRMVRGAMYIPTTQSELEVYLNEILGG